MPLKERGRAHLEIKTLGRHEVTREVVLEEADGAPGRAEREGEERRRGDGAL